jgi:hypothetical protein
MALHRNAQALLEPVHVVNPFADRLTFLDDKTRTRRDHMKYLTLIRAIALLHQHQRPRRSIEHRGQALRYIEVTESDIALANRLAHEVLGRTLDELPPQTRTLLSRIHCWVQGECERLALRRCDLRFTRRQMRDVTGWGDTQLKVHIGRLADLEYVLVHRMKVGQGHEYELLYDGEGEAGERFVMGLSGPGIGAPIEDCSRRYDDRRSGQKASRSPPGRGADGARSAGGRTTKIPPRPASPPRSDDGASDLAETHLLAVNGTAASYPHPASA